MGLVPSESLPTLTRDTDPSTVQPILTSLTNSIFAPQIVHIPPVCFTPDSAENQKSRERNPRDAQSVKPVEPTLASLDDFEERFLVNWLERVICIGMNWEESEQWATIVDQAARLTSVFAGQSAAGSQTRIWKFPAPFRLQTPPATRPQTPISDKTFNTFTENMLSICIRDTTLTSNSTGFRTWGSAPILVQLLAVNPYVTFQPNSRILELGSGTGLVGLATIALLDYCSISAYVKLTDYEEHILNNLRYNLLHMGMEKQATVERLDWSVRNYVQRRFETILGADLIYEPEQVEWLLNTVASVLAFPSKSIPLLQPVFHLVIQLRPRHLKECTLFDQLIHPSTQEARWVRHDIDGQTYRLVTLHKTRVYSPDDFGKKAHQRTVEYMAYRIGWELH